jgi:AraC-like DNA-binding protein
MKFSTDELRPHERFDHWCEVRGRYLFGGTITIEQDRRMGFYGNFSAKPVGGAILGEMRASSYIVARTDADIDRVPGNGLCISQQVRGAGSLETGNNTVHCVNNGAMAVGNTDVPYRATPYQSDGFHFRTLKIPFAGNDDLARAAHALALAPLPTSHFVTQLIEGIFNTLVVEDVAFGDAQQAVRDIAQLALLARGRAAPRTEESRNALQSGYLHVANRLIASNLHRADLSPDMVAAALGISVRKLHLLFEPTGVSFSRTLMTMRLTEARRRLMLEPGKRVAEIAFACGFDSLATFYRAFRQAYHVTPGDVRQMDAVSCDAAPIAEAAAG